MKISKLFLISGFIKVGLVATISCVYLSEVVKQVELNEQLAKQNLIIKQHNPFMEPFLSLLHKAEGYSTTFYPDNKGVAIGYGYNPTQNAAEYNRDILKYAGVDHETADRIIAYSKNSGKNPSKALPQLSDIKLTSAQLHKMVEYSQGSYESDFKAILQAKMNLKKLTAKEKIKIWENYQNLYPNQKAVLTHMSYKVGSNNLLKYNKFFDSLISYLKNPTQANKEVVAKNFAYSYTKGKQKFSDDRVAQLHHNLFLYVPEPSKQPPVNEVIVKHPDIPNKTDEEKMKEAMHQINHQITLAGFLGWFKNMADKHWGNSNQVEQESITPAPQIIEKDDEYDYDEEKDYYEVSLNSPKPKIKG